MRSPNSCQPFPTSTGLPTERPPPPQVRLPHQRSSMSFVQDTKMVLQVSSNRQRLGLQHSITLWYNNFEIWFVVDKTEKTPGKNRCCWRLPHSWKRLLVMPLVVHLQGIGMAGKELQSRSNEALSPMVLDSLALTRKAYVLFRLSFIEANICTSSQDNGQLHNFYVFLFLLWNDMLGFLDRIRTLIDFLNTMLKSRLQHVRGPLDTFHTLPTKVHKLAWKVASTPFCPLLPYPNHQIKEIQRGTWTLSCSLSVWHWRNFHFCPRTLWPILPPLSF